MDREKPRIHYSNNFRNEGILPEKAEQDPLTIVRTTGTNLNLLLYADVDKRPLDDYFKDVTLPHLKFVEEAVDDYFDPDNPKVYTRQFGLLRNDSSATEEEYARASVDLYSVIFSAIPDTFKNPRIKQGFSRKGYLVPPASGKEMSERITELKDTLRGFMYGNLTSNDLYTFNLNSPAVRTFAFYNVGSELPLHMPRSNYEAEQLSAEMIKDSVIDLPDKPKTSHELQQEELARQREEMRNKEITLFEKFVDEIDIDLE